MKPVARCTSMACGVWTFGYEKCGDCGRLFCNQCLVDGLCRPCKIERERKEKSNVK